MSEIVNCYFIRFKRRLALIYHERGAGAFIRFYGDGRWEDAQIITEDVSGGLSVNISYDDNIFVFCQDGGGNIVMHHYDGANWKSAAIRKNAANTLYNLRIYAITTKAGIYLLYNIPSDITGGLIRYKIVLQELSSGKWTEHAQIQPVLDSAPVFTVHSVNKEHYIVYYTEAQSGSESAFGYRELYIPDKWSDFKSLYSTKNTIADKSMITTGEGLHAAITVKGPRCQLIYRNKLGPETGTQLALFESPVIENVILFMYSGSIYIVFSAGSYGYFSTVSRNGGATFSRPARINGNTRLIKAEYAANAREYDCFIGNVLTDGGEPGAAFFLEEILPFYTLGSSAVNINDAMDAQKPQKMLLRDEQDINEQKEQENENNRRFAALEKKLEEAYRGISEKERQITELNALLSRQGEGEWSESAGKLRAENTEKAETITRLQERILELQGENALLAASLEQSKNDNLFLEKRLSDIAAESLSKTVAEPAGEPPEEEIELPEPENI